MPRLARIDRDAERFGRIITRLRLEKGWQKKTLAERIRISPQYMGIIERGENIPSLKIILDLLETLGGSVSQTMDELLTARKKARE